MNVSRFWAVSAFIETVLWTIMVPYMIWQLYGGWFAIALLAWWLVGYWRLIVVGMYKMYLINKLHKSMFDKLTEEGSDPIDAYSQMLHDFIDNNDGDVPDFSDN